MEEKAANQILICSQCGYKINDLQATRCPRCFKVIPIHTECQGCGKCATSKI